MSSSKDTECSNNADNQLPATAIDFSPFFVLAGLGQDKARKGQGGEVDSPACSSTAVAPRTVFTIRADAVCEPFPLPGKLKLIEEKEKEGFVTLSAEVIEPVGETDGETKALGLGEQLQTEAVLLTTNVAAVESSRRETGETDETKLESNHSCGTEEQQEKSETEIDNNARSNGCLESCDNGQERRSEDKSTEAEQDKENFKDIHHSEIELQENLKPSTFKARNKGTYTPREFEEQCQPSSDNVDTLDKSCQTVGTPLTASVDFYLWERERRRLARYGWCPMYSPFPHYPIYANGTTSEHTRDQQRQRRPRRSRLGSHSSANHQASNIDAAKGREPQSCTTSVSSASKSVSFDVNAKSVTEKSSANLDNKISDNSLESSSKVDTTTPVDKTEERSHSISDDNHHTEISAETNDWNHVNGFSDSSGHRLNENIGEEKPETPSSSNTATFDSESTTPRVDIKTPDVLNSSRSISIQSDSGTSISVTSDILAAAKPPTDRTKPSSFMAEVTSNLTPTSSEVPDSPHSVQSAPTLKVEYVTKVWDAYINDFLLGSDHIKHAAIFDRATSTCIACSFGFSIKDEEYAQLHRSLNSLREATEMGVTLQENHYKTILADGRRGLMAKGAGRSGCSACQTRTLVLVAVHDHTGKAARCNEEVMRLGDFFWAKGL